jgi:hypothetical protein
MGPHRFATVEGAVNLVVHRLVSRTITMALEAAPAALPLAVAERAAKNVLSALNELSLSEREKQKQVEEEDRHDQEWQFAQIERHDYERDR